MQVFDPKDQNFRTILTQGGGARRPKTDCQQSRPVSIPVQEPCNSRQRVLIWTGGPDSDSRAGNRGKGVSQQTRNPNQHKDKRGSGWWGSGGRASAI